MASIERFELPDGNSAEIHRRPSHGQLTQYERRIRSAQSGDTPGMGAEDASVEVFVHQWDIRDGDGKAIPFRTASYGDVPAHVWVALVDEIAAVVDALRPADAMVGVLRALRALADAVPLHRPRITEISDELSDLSGKTRPNPEAQEE